MTFSTLMLDKEKFTKYCGWVSIVLAIVKIPKVKQGQLQRLG
jgi:hypothetical protein